MPLKVICLVFAVLFAAASWLSLGGQGQAAVKSTIIMGSGQRSCTYWLSEGRQGGPASLRMQQWLFGFVTSFNLNAHGGDNVARGHSTEELLGWVDGYCSQNREHQLSTAAIALILALRKAQ